MHGNAAIAEKAVRQTEVHEWLDRLQQSLESAQKVQTEVHNRLSPVLKEPGCGNDKEAATPEPMLVPVADRLRKATKAVDELIKDNRNLLEMLEV